MNESDTNYPRRDWKLASKEEIIRGYQEMSSDVEAEAKALEWSEAFIGETLEMDASDERIGEYVYKEII